MVNKSSPEASRSTQSELRDLSRDIYPIQSINFHNRYGTLLLDVGGPEILEQIVPAETLTELTEYGFTPKDELHITVLNYDNGRRVLTQLRDEYGDNHEQALRSFQEIAHQVDWSWRPSGELIPFSKSKNGRALKIITLIDCPGAADYYRRIEEALPAADIVHHPMHITILKKPLESAERLRPRVGGLSLENPLQALGHLALGY